MASVVSSEIIKSTAVLLGDSPSPMMLFTPDLTILYANPSHERMTGRKADELIGRYMFDVFEPDPNQGGEASAKGAIEAAVAVMVGTGQSHVIDEQQHDLANADGVYEARYWSMVQWPIHEQGKVVAILQRSEDVTERVRQRRLTDAVRQAAEDISGLSFFSYNPDTDRFVRNPAVDAMFGFGPDEAGPMAAPFLKRILPEDLPAVHEEIERSIASGVGSSASFDYRVAIPGVDVLRLIRVRAGVERDPDDGEIKLFGAFVDLTDIEQARAGMEALSKLNAALVVESNHRIKNSLAIASAMLSYQMRANENEAAEQALQVAATRIMAIADVHGELFSDSGVEWVDGGRLLERFVRSFINTVDPDGNGCRIETRLQSIRLPSRYAVTMALMLNELLTNAIKSGMSQVQALSVSVVLAAEEGTGRLTVENTIAVKQFAQIVSEGVGTELVHAFAQQLDGSVEAAELDGKFRVIFTFPIPPDDIELREADPTTAK